MARPCGLVVRRRPDSIPQSGVKKKKKEACNCQKKKKKSNIYNVLPYLNNNK